MKLALALPLLLARLALAQPAATQPATKPLDRTTPLGTCKLFDATVADVGIDGAMKFYHCTSNAQRRYARSECEFYIAMNRLVRVVQSHIGDAAAAVARNGLGDSDDYTHVKIDAEGDAASLTRGDSKPLDMIRINNDWYFSMPGWFAAQSSEDLQTTRAYYETAADKFDAIREQVDAGKITTRSDLEEQLQAITSSR